MRREVKITDLWRSALSTLILLGARNPANFAAIGLTNHDALWRQRPPTATSQWRGGPRPGPITLNACQYIPQIRPARLRTIY